MKIFKHKESLKKEISGNRNLHFIPTMGNLHNGHKYLIRKAKKKDEKVIVSIYINPKQFNSKTDFHNYPRNINKDIKILKELKVDYLYAPNYEDIYLFKTKNKIYLDKFSKQLCGKFRKSHFKGVLNVVNRLLEIIEPKTIILGKKDFQQLYLIKKHIQKNNINTNVVAGKTIREKNGVACSSRNKNLSSSEMSNASNIFLYLKKSKSKNLNLVKIKNKFKEYGVNKIDYIKILDIKTLKKPDLNKSKYNIFVAYYFRKTRLIDNF